MSRRGYPKEFREAAVERISNGEKVTHVSKELGISYTTLAGWCRKAGIEARQYKEFVPESKAVTDIGRLVMLHQCQLVMTSPGWWECTHCGGTIDWDSCDPNDPPACKYCPNCGSEVIES